MEAYLKKEEYQKKQHEGKHELIGSILDPKPICKPYMYLIKDGYQTAKQKLDIRHKMLELEYINATLRLIQDKNAYDQGDKDHIIGHLVDVSRDAQYRDWDDVLRWSQSVWDNIEKDPEFKWENKQQIQNERFSQAIVGGHNKRNKQGARNVEINDPSTDPYAMKGVVCRDFNSDRGCRYRAHHSHNGNNFLHVCGHCWQQNKRLSHPYSGCQNRHRDRPNTHTSQSGGWQHSTQHQQVSQTSKNGQ